MYKNKKKSKLNLCVYFKQVGLSGFWDNPKSRKKLVDKYKAFKEKGYNRDKAVKLTYLWLLGGCGFDRRNIIEVSEKVTSEIECYHALGFSDRMVIIESYDKFYDKYDENQSALYTAMMVLMIS